jgi:hypothetical protein
MNYTEFEEIFGAFVKKEKDGEKVESPMSVTSSNENIGGVFPCSVATRRD